VGALAILAVGGAYGLLRASLAPLDGEAYVPALVRPVTIERDALGVATVRAENRLDAARATGFVHATERFFQMDLARRDASGALAELFGARALHHDRERRAHGFAEIAREVLAAVTPAERALLEAYADGANAGLAALRARPFEYFLLRARPEPWRAEDSILVIFAMYLLLHAEQLERERLLAALAARLPPALVEFLAPPGTEWDAPLAGEPWPPSKLPDPAVCTLRQAPMAPPLDVRESPVIGSNAWAVSAGGRALLANDMHLGLRAPNIWYRLRVRVASSGLDVSGLTLPGNPVLVAGSNGRIAWGFTNAPGDWLDQVPIALDPEDPTRYQTAGGGRRFRVRLERIRVRGEADVFARYRSTEWGPVIGEAADGTPLALRWIAHRPAATNLRLLAFERARSAAEAIALAPGVGIPPQNLLVADREGHIGWTILGRVPLRAGGSWQGWLAAEDYPRIVDPDERRLWSANARPLGGVALERLGDGGYAFGARSRQIRDALRGLESPTVADMLALQLDDRALFLERWRALLLATLSEEAIAEHPRRAELRREVERWEARATIASSGYRLVREFRRAVHDRAIGALADGCASAPIGPFNLGLLHQIEGPLWRLVSERPRHLLPARFDSWQALLLAGADRAASDCGEGPLAGCAWGEANAVRITHPLAGALGPIGRLLDLHDGPLPGDVHMPRVQRGPHGASVRFGVSPGRENEGYLHMPGGQSGHPLSPFYRAGHDAWLRGEPLPFLPGATSRTLVLRPAP